MTLKHLIQYQNNELEIVVYYDTNEKQVEEFIYAVIRDNKGQVDISDIFTSYLNGEQIIDSIDWEYIYKTETIYERENL